MLFARMGSGSDPVVTSRPGSDKIVRTLSQKWCGLGLTLALTLLLARSLAGLLLLRLIRV